MMRILRDSCDSVYNLIAIQAMRKVVPTFKSPEEINCHVANEKQEEKAQETPERPKIVKSTRSDNPDVVYGRDFEFDEETKIAELFDD